MRCAISAFAGFVLAGSVALAQPIDGRLKVIHETATLRVAYRTDSQPFSYVDAGGRPVGYTIELCRRIAKSLEEQLNVVLAIKWVPVDVSTRFEAIVNGTADMECGSTTVSLSRMRIVDFSSVVFAESTGVLVKSGRGTFFFRRHGRQNYRGHCGQPVDPAAHLSLGLYRGRWSGGRRQQCAGDLGIYGPPPQSQTDLNAFTRMREVGPAACTCRRPQAAPGTAAIGVPVGTARCARIMWPRPRG